MDDIKVKSKDGTETLTYPTPQKTTYNMTTKDVTDVIEMMEKNLKKLPSLDEVDEDDSSHTNENYPIIGCNKIITEKTLPTNISNVTNLIYDDNNKFYNNKLNNIDHGFRSIFEVNKDVIRKEMEIVKGYLKDMDTCNRVSLRSIIETGIKNDGKESFLQSILDTQDKNVIEEFRKFFVDEFNMALRVPPGNDIFLSLVPKDGRKCNCNICLEGCTTKRCLKLNDKLINGQLKDNNQSSNDEKIQNELDYFINEIEQRGDSNVPFIDVCNQYLIDKKTTSTLFTMFYNGTNDEYCYCIDVLSKEFNLTWNNCDGLTLSMKDLDFGGETSIEKPCSLAHEKEIENGLEAVVAGGDILCEDGTVNYYGCKKVLQDNTSNVINTSGGDDDKEMSITEMLINKAGFENGDALEQFICSRIENYISETGYDRIPINELDSVINSFFEMHVDPVKEFGMGWGEVCQKWVDKKYLYFSKDKNAIMVTDPDTPEVYLEDRDKIFSDNQEDNERIIDELAMHGINLRPYVLFRNGQPHVIIEDASIENKSN